MANRNSQGGIILVLGVLVVGLIALVLFAHRPTKFSTPTIKPDFAELSASLDINVYLDGSGSIKHFLQKAPAKDDGIAPPKYYVEDVLNKTENILHNSSGGDSETWKDAKLHLWKFGTGEPKPLSGGGLQTMRANLDSFDQKNTLIEKPIDQARQGDDSDSRAELKIILTDLYESNGQLGGPAEHLADKYLKDEKSAVGVLAIRSPFTGPVEDLPGSNGKTFPDAADSMPFYLIFAGPAGDVLHAMDLMVEGIELRDALKSGKAVEFFFSRASQAPDADIKMTFTPKRVYTALPDTDVQGIRIPQIRLSKDVQAQWDNRKRDDANFAKIATGEELVPKAVGGKGAPQEAEPTKIAEKCDGSEQFCMLVSRSKMTPKATYAFQFDLIQHKDPDALQPESELMKHWNIEVPASEEISRMPTPSFPRASGRNPGLTPSLSLFLSTLQNQMFSSPVRATSYYLLVQAD